jgi:GSH-dependent disulfide-bond oxidoreductase
MITLYAHGSPNPHKISITLEELGLPYEAKIINVWEGEQFSPEFIALNPNGKVPVITDHETGYTIYESNAILLYLAQKTGKLFPTEVQQQWKGYQLLFFQAASIGAMFGQRAHFSLFAPEKPNYAVERYLKEGERLTKVLEELLTGREYFLDEYSIVDIAHFGWLWCSTHQGFNIDTYPNLKAWFERVAVRPAVQKGVTIPLELSDFTPFRSAA